MGEGQGSERHGKGKPNTLHLLGWLAAAAALITILFVFYPVLLEPGGCVALVAVSGREVAVPLPPDCVQSANVPEDDMVKYLENEPHRSGLVFKSWITCSTSSQAQAAGFAFERAFERDPRWLPSYVPRTYQFRRTVVILPYARPVPEKSPVVAQVCRVPWRRYVSQIAGECNGKFSVWK